MCFTNASCFLGTNTCVGNAHPIYSELKPVIFLLLVLWIFLVNQIKRTYRSKFLFPSGLYIPHSQIQTLSSTKREGSGVSWVCSGRSIRSNFGSYTFCTEKQATPRRRDFSASEYPHRQWEPR